MSNGTFDPNREWQTAVNARRTPAEDRHLRAAADRGVPWAVEELQDYDRDD